VKGWDIRGLIGEELALVVDGVRNIRNMKQKLRIFLYLFNFTLL
jgi:hypothetical protein